MTNIMPAATKQVHPFNVNGYVCIRLTPHGRRILKDSDQGYRLSLDSSNREDAEGWSRWQLWDLMAIFGTHLHNGCTLPFETWIQFEVEE